MGVLKGYRSAKGTMRASSIVRFGLGILIAAAAIPLGCSSNDNQPATTGGGSSSSGGGSGSGGGSSSGSGGSQADGGGNASDANAGDGAVPACDPNLKDKTTTCMPGIDPPTCNKGCGPELPGGTTYIGNKACNCGSSGVWTCGSCSYVTPLPACYQPSASPSACAATVADKNPCTTPCSGNGTGNDVCTLTTDAGKSDGCVCIVGNMGTPVWTCQTRWW